MRRLISAVGAPYTPVIVLSSHRPCAVGRPMTATDLILPVLGGSRVLVLDHDADAAASLTALLRLNGFDARAAETVADALAAVHSTRPPVFIFDPALLASDWRRLVRRLAAMPQPPAVVVVTGDTDPRTRRAATEAGVVAFLLKPAEPEEVVRLVQRLSAPDAA